jgi:hypothetical protein
MSRKAIKQWNIFRSFHIHSRATKFYSLALDYRLHVQLVTIRSNLSPGIEVNKKIVASLSKFDIANRIVPNIRELAALLLDGYHFRVSKLVALRRWIDSVAEGASVHVRRNEEFAAILFRRRVFSRFMGRWGNRHQLRSYTRAIKWFNRKQLEHGFVALSRFAQHRSHQRRLVSSFYRLFRLLHSIDYWKRQTRRRLSTFAQRRMVRRCARRYNHNLCRTYFWWLRYWTAGRMNRARRWNIVCRRIRRTQLLQTLRRLFAYALNKQQQWHMARRYRCERAWQQWTAAMSNKIHLSISLRRAALRGDINSATRALRKWKARTDESSSLRRRCVVFRSFHRQMYCSSQHQQQMQFVRVILRRWRRVFVPQQQGQRLSALYLLRLHRRITARKACHVWWANMEMLSLLWNLRKHYWRRFRSWMQYRRRRYDKLRWRLLAAAHRHPSKFNHMQQFQSFADFTLQVLSYSPAAEVASSSSSSTPGIMYHFFRRLCVLRRIFISWQLFTVQSRNDTWIINQSRNQSVLNCVAVSSQLDKHKHHLLHSTFSVWKECWVARGELIRIIQVNLVLKHRFAHWREVQQLQRVQQLQQQTILSITNVMANESLTALSALDRVSALGLENLDLSKIVAMNTSSASGTNANNSSNSTDVVSKSILGDIVCMDSALLHFAPSVVLKVRSQQLDNLRRNTFGLAKRESEVSYISSQADSSKGTIPPLPSSSSVQRQRSRKEGQAASRHNKGQKENSGSPAGARPIWGNNITESISDAQSRSYSGMFVKKQQRYQDQPSV